MKFSLQVAAIVTVMATSMLAMPAQAQRRVKVNTSSGVLGGGRAIGPNGGTAACAYGVRYGSTVGRACGVNGQNGYSYGSSGAKEGVGVYRKTGRSYTNPVTGNTTSGSLNKTYNAQTDQGRSSIDRSVTVGGTSYGYDKDRTYTYTPGSGYSGTTTITTDQHGTYNCSYTSGLTRTCSKP
jgi:hypothetical protein